MSITKANGVDNAGSVQQCSSPEVDGVDLAANLQPIDRVFDRFGLFPCEVKFLETRHQIMGLRK